MENQYPRTLIETKDHIIPRSKGGNGKLLNLIDACHECNGLKGNYLPEEFSQYLNELLLGNLFPKKNNFPKHRLQIIYNNNELLIKKIEPHRTELYNKRYKGILFDIPESNFFEEKKQRFLEEERDFFELLKQNTEKSAKIQNVKTEKLPKQKREPNKPRYKVINQIEWSVEDYSNFFKNNEHHFHYL